MNKFFSLFLAVITATNLNAQNVELKLTLRDGNVLSGQSKLGNVSLQTDYGKLEIPLKNVMSIDVGITPDKANSEKIISTVKQLSNSAEEVRKSAYETLLKMNIGAIPIISDFVYSGKYEYPEYTDYTVDMVLSELQSLHGVADGYSTMDVVSIDYEYTMGGTYAFKVIDLKTEYGNLSIPKEKIKHIDVMYVQSDESGELKFILQASKHISGNTNGGWLKTGIMLRAGQKITITAGGEVVLASLSNNKYKPDGAVKSGASAENGYDDYYEGTSASYPNYGNVVYKIGETGTAIKAGAKYSSAVKASGMLYLSIYETVYNPANTGSYVVKILLK